MTLETPSHQRRGAVLHRSRQHGAHAASFGHHAAPSRRSRRAATAAAHRERTRWMAVSVLLLAAPFAASLGALWGVR
ncbi:MAG: hypothetical protein WCG96_02225 [Actinomycetes bacterium]